MALSIDSETRVAVYPMFETFGVRPLLRLRPQPLRRPHLLANAHLGSLGRDLWMFGFDTDWHNDLGDATLVRLAAAEGRMILTRDCQFLMHRRVTHVCDIRHGSAGDQLAYLVESLVDGTEQCCAGLVEATGGLIVADGEGEGIELVECASGLEVPGRLGQGIELVVRVATRWRIEGADGDTLLGRSERILHRAEHRRAPTLGLGRNHRDRPIQPAVAPSFSRPPSPI